MSRPTPLKLYGFGPSRSFRALWALEETGLAFEHIEAALRKDATLENSAKHPNYLALNSQGKVPTLVDGDKVLTESVAIVNYIARLAPESKLIPTSVSELEQPLWSKGKHLFALPEEQRVPAMFDTAAFEWAKAVRSLDALLDESEFALGDQFSAIDILLAHTFNWAQRFEFDVPEKYIALRDRHFARPAAQRALASMA
ncbi:MAG: glutathione S-transferase family protein [OM182 bacterium]|jgi:glutathione S-transferase